ncbi:hypothetical protein JXR93_00085 [bacterium]|nr:hypothetical protein [bacterium]
MKYFYLFLFLSISIFATENRKIPLLYLNGNSESFFVLGSDIPFNIDVFEKTDWISVDKLSGDSMFQTAVTIYGTKTDDLSGVKYNSIKVNFKNSKGNSDYILIPVVMANSSFSDSYLIKNLPQKYIKLTTELDNIEVNLMMTPSGNYVFEIINLENQYKLFNKTPNRVATQTYEIVFPWFCLEFCSSSRTAEVEHAEVTQQLDALIGVSYERYTMNGGIWQTLNVTNPTTLIIGDSLQAWPMINANTRRPEHDEAYITNYINQLWDNREELSNSMISEATTNGYTGYCLDVETQKVVTETQDKYIALVDYFSKRLHEHGKKLMVAHATWSTIAPMSRLSGETEVDYVATMDPYTKSTLFFENNGDETRGQAYKDYHAIESHRLIWGFAWEYHDSASQANQFEWLETKGYNIGVAGAAVWRTPAVSTNGINYYDAFRRYYPVDKCSNRDCGEFGVCVSENGVTSCDCDRGYIFNGDTCIIDEEGIWKTDLVTIDSNKFFLKGAIPLISTEKTSNNESVLVAYSDKNSPSFEAIWEFTIQISGEYDLMIYIPELENSSNIVISPKFLYTLTHNGEISYIQFDTTNKTAGWYNLGTFYFGSDNINNLSLNNFTDFENSSRIVFNQVKIEGFVKNE